MEGLLKAGEHGWCERDGFAGGDVRLQQGLQAANRGVSADLLHGFGRFKLRNDSRYGGTGGRGLSDHLVCLEEERRGHHQAQGLGRLEMDDQLERGGLLSEQIAWVGTFQDGGKDSGQQLTNVSQRTLGSSRLFIRACLALIVPCGIPLSLTRLPKPATLALGRERGATRVCCAGGDRPTCHGGTPTPPSKERLMSISGRGARPRRNAHEVCHV